ncbi:amidohydrolase [Rhizobium sp. 1AS11]|uniref:amidohydrolase family protein n=1 Tax=Rhizobium acaciae TaxID=2989736 RepID=UPI00222285BB|nr:amidohydrolase family protein [Rhizobium acaciae]MCW1411285.1 amidohydrolase [Rhizobium acaciae]MCW1743303.1 amidohydrolase [Rhizobium acaciae]
MTEIYDIHPHIVSGDTTRYPVVPLMGKRSDWSHERSTDLDQLLAGMKQTGVAKAAIVHSSTTYGFDNSYVADAVALYPDRFTGVFSSDVLADDAVEKLVYWKDRGLTGLRIFSKGSTIDRQWLSLDDPRLYPVYEKCQELALSVCVNIHANEEELKQVHAVLKRFPAVNLLLDHLGRVKVSDGAPYAKAEPLFDLAAYPNMFLKLTPRLLEDINAPDSKATAETFLPKLVQEFGSDKIAFGSNYPSSEGTYVKLVETVTKAVSVLGAKDQANILSGTAKGLYPALAVAVPA